MRPQSIDKSSSYGTMPSIVTLCFKKAFIESVPDEFTLSRYHIKN